MDKSLVSSSRDKNTALRGKIPTKRVASRPERIMADALVRSHLSFQYSVMIGGREIDFIVEGSVAVEVDGSHHRWQQDRDKEKNHILVCAGYTPLHFSAHEVRQNVGKCIKQIKRIIHG